MAATDLEATLTFPTASTSSFDQDDSEVFDFGSSDRATGVGGDEWAGAWDAGRQVLAALEETSRRMRDLASELNCLGYFDNDDGGPRAA